jgi:hypothetical protein
MENTARTKRINEITAKLTHSLNLAPKSFDSNFLSNFVSKCIVYENELKNGVRHVRSHNFCKLPSEEDLKIWFDNNAFANEGIKKAYKSLISEEVSYKCAQNEVYISFIETILEEVHKILNK